MDAEYLKYLRKYHSKLYDNLVIERKLKEKSTFISLLKIKSNKAYEILTKSAITSADVPRPFLSSLLSNGYIRETDTYGYTTITCKGVWEIESGEGALNFDQLIQCIDIKFFDVFKSVKPLTDKEKIILLSMISVRSFSKQSVLDLKRNDRVLTELQELSLSAFRLLYKHKKIKKLKEDEIFGAEGNEKPVSNLFRHSDSLKKKTKGIFKTIWPQKHYLDLFDGDEVSENGLVTLFELIVKNQLTLELKNNLRNFCLENAYKRSVYIYDFPQHIFTSPEYDEIIPEALERCYARLSK